MKICWISDIHLGNHKKFGGPVVGGLNLRAFDCLEAMSKTVGTTSVGSYAHRQQQMVVLGDMFDYSRPEARLIHETNIWLGMFAHKPWVLSGNHDQVSAMYGDTAVAALSPTDCVSVQATKVARFGEVEMVFIPFREGNALEFIETELKALGAYPVADGKRVVLNLHVGISDNNAPYYLDKSKACIRAEDMFNLCKKYGITHVMSGDWHRHQIWKKDGITICQVGSLCPSRFPPNHEHGHVGPMVTMDTTTGKIEVKNIPGPRFYKFRWESVDQAWMPPVDATPAYVKVTCQPRDREAAEGWLKQIDVNCALQDKPGLRGTELDVDNAKALAKARTASFEARKASSLEEAVGRYVGSMPLAEGVEREQVLSKIRKLLSAAG